jgi:hypothetical protein
MEEHTVKECNPTLYLLFTDDPHDPHLAHVKLSEYIRCHNKEELSTLGGDNFLIFADYDLAKSVMNHFGGAE